MRHLVWTALLLVSGGIARAHAQSPVRLVIGPSGGATYYCIASRCNTGTTLGVWADVEARRLVGLELAARRHFCVDCSRFVLADAALMLRYPARTIQPFLAAGVTRSSDPDFMGTQAGPLGAAGAWAGLNPFWGARLELRGRKLGRGDGMGELSLSLAHRFGGR